MPVVPPLETGHYYLYQELAAYLRTAEEAAPHLLRLFSVGNSYEGRPIYLAEITNRAKGEGLEKPAIWVDGNLHGSELLSSSACLELIRQLVSDYGRDPVITDLLDNCTFYIVPRLSPDGAEQSLNGGELLHSGSRPLIRSGFNLRGGDVNGDGRVLQMRVPDEAGEWKPSRRDARLLVRRQADDRGGPFYRLYPEGFLEGSLNAPIRPHSGRNQLDFDKNFPCGWRPEVELQGSGPFPLSEPETRAVADFFRTRNNICVAVSCSSWGGGVSYPQSSGTDLALFQELGRRIQEITGFNVNPAPAAPGSFLQWAYEHRGVVAFRPQLWCLARAVGLEVEEPLLTASERSEPECLSMLRWLDREAPNYGFVPWTNADHPQLGQVELGGWDPLYSWLNPPPGPLIQETSEKFVRMVIALACGLPRLRVRKISEELLGWSEFVPPDAQQGDFLPLRRLTVEVENSGFLPCWLTEQARNMKIAALMDVRLHLDPSTLLLLGESVATSPPLRGCSDICADDPPWGRFEWVVRGTGLAQAEFIHDKSGISAVSWAYDGGAGYGQVQHPQSHFSPPAVAPQMPAPPPAMPQHRPPPGPRRSVEMPAAAARGPAAAPPSYGVPIQQAPPGPRRAPGHQVSAAGHPPAQSYDTQVLPSNPPQQPNPHEAPQQHFNQQQVPRQHPIQQPAPQQPPRQHPIQQQAPQPPPRQHPNQQQQPPRQQAPQLPPQHPQANHPAQQHGAPIHPGHGQGQPTAATGRPPLPQRQVPMQEMPPGFGNLPAGVQPPVRQSLKSNPQTGPRAPLGPPPGQPMPAPPAAPTMALGAPLGAPVDGGPESPARGRVLGSPPTKPGAVPAPAAANFATRAQELVQARRESQENPRRSEEGFSPGLPIKEPPRRDDAFTPGLAVKDSGFAPGLPVKDAAFSPGLPMKSAYPGGPADSATSLDFDTMPPEAPPSESRIPTPLLLRRRPKE